MNTSSIRRFLLAGILAAVSGIPAARAVNTTWTSSSDTTWSTGTNWNNGVPGVLAADRAFFASTSGTANPNIATSATTGAVTFSTGTFTLSASPSQTLTLLATTSGTTSAIYSASGTNVISAPLIFGAATGTQAIGIGNNAAYSLTISGPITSTNAITLSFAGGSSNPTLAVTGDITLPGTVSCSGGPVTLSGSNSFGAVSVGSGGFKLQSANALGSSGNITFTSNGNIQYSASNTVDYAARFKNSSGSIALDTASQNVTLNGLIDSSNTGGLRKLGAGTLTLANAANSFTGDIAITTGSLSVAGIGNAGNAGYLGAGSVIGFSNNGVAGTLVYTGTGETTNRTVSFSDYRTTTGTIDQSGSGLLKFTADLQTITNATAITRTLTLKGSTAGTGEFAGVIGNGGSGTTKLTKDGTGTWTLSGSNSYTGTTSVIGGTLALTGAGSIVSTGAVNVNASGATFDISGITASGLTIGSLAGAAGSVVTLGSKTLTVGDATSTTTFAGVMGGSGGLTKVGASKLTLSSPNTFTGDTLISSGTLGLGDYQALQFSRVDTSGAGVIDVTARGGMDSGGLVGSKNLADVFVNITNATFNLTVNSQAGVTSTYSGNIVDFKPGSKFTKNGTGTQILSGSNSYTGETIVSAGVLQFNSANALPGGIGSTGGSSALTISGGVIGLGAGDFTRALGAGTDQVQFTAGGGFAAYGADRVVNLGGASGAVTWNTGNFIPNTGSGPLILGAADATHTVNFQNPISFGAVATNTRTVQVDNGSATIDAVLSGNLTGSGTFSKTGLGTLALTGSNSYTGETIVSAGTLLVNGTHSGTGNVSVSSGATLGGNGTVGGATNLVSGGTLSPGTGPGTLAFSSNLTLAGGTGALGTTAIFEGGDLVTVAGTLTLTNDWNLTLTTGFQDGGTVTLFTYATVGGTRDLTPDFNISGLGFTPTSSLTLTDTGSSIVLNGISVVPEPATWALLAFSLTTVMVLRRRRNS